MENNYQLSRIHNYVNGLLSKEEMYVLEREALDDPFLQDAIDGYKLQNGVDIKPLSLLQQRLAVRVAEKSTGRSKRYYNWQRLTIGLVAGVMFVAACTLILLRFIPSQKIEETNQVFVSDTMYEYTIIPNQNRVGLAIPVGGWRVMTEVLNSKYSNSHKYLGTILVVFDLDQDNRVVNINLEGDGFVEDEELKDLIRNKVKWEGQKGDFLIDIRQIGR